MPKDSVDLICSVAELAGLFEQSTGLDDFLQGVVDTIAFHMKASVCSIYLCDEERNELVMKATHGLNPQAVGTVALRYGEGITGRALKELRPIRAGSASSSPFFKAVPGIYEERYESFLAVPILHGLARVGVLVVQHERKEFFDENDTRALQAIATQLATTIENANLLISLHEMKGPPSEERPQAAEDFLRGTTVSEGIVCGKATVLGLRDADLAIYLDDNEVVPAALEDFQEAHRATEAQLKELQRQTEASLGDVAALIFSAHLLILRDTAFGGAMEQRIRDGAPAVRAIVDVVNEFIHRFSAGSSPMLREKVQDLKDLGHRLLRNLRGREEEEAADYAGRIVVCGELLPSDIIKLAAQHVLGIVMVGSLGSMSHVSILARSLLLPMVLVRDPRILALRGETTVLVDADQGNVFVNPAADLLDTYASIRSEREREEGAVPAVDPETYTADGQRVVLLANINLLGELAMAERYRAEGIGLYRSEFPFLVRNDFPSEEEQYRIYRKLVEGADGKPVTFRTLDIGGDKVLSYFPAIGEGNPFLGLRAIRFSLRYRDVFGCQLRAFLRAGEGRPVRIMFPLVSSVDDFIEARDVVRECLRELADEERPHQNDVLLGAMVELPSAVEVVEELAREADFLSIGSNDLIQHLLGVDRTNEELSDLYLPYHPAVLRAFHRIARAAAGAGTPLTLCGQVAADHRLTAFLLGIGLRSFSVEPRALPALQSAIANVDAVRAEADAKALLGLGRIREVEAFLGLADD